MKYHILNGDSLRDQIDQLNIHGELIVARECLIEGPVSAQELSAFWVARARFVQEAYGSTGNYAADCQEEFEKIQKIESGAEINLWFEEDLFCQVNFWFCAHLIHRWGIFAEVFWVAPTTTDWSGFGGMSPKELWQAFFHRKQLDGETISELNNCWLAYQKNDLPQLRILATSLQPLFPSIEEVVKAHAQRFPKSGLPGRPQKTLMKIIDQLNDPGFGPVFQQFCSQEGIYGFGDLQLKRMYEEVKRIK